MPSAPALHDGPTLVVCVGDSITQGQVSSNYVRMLEHRWQPRGVSFVNAGVNGDLAFHVAARLDQVIRQSPDVVTLLVGTNDVNVQFAPGRAALEQANRQLPVCPSREWYGEQVGVVLARLRAETDAAVAVLEIPPLGEDLGSRMNGLVNDYNATLREVARSHGVSVLPLHQRLVQLLPEGAVAPVYLGEHWLVMAATLERMVLRRSWDDISRSFGLHLTTDHVHLNDRAAGVVAELIGGFVQEASRSPRPDQCTGTLSQGPVRLEVMTGIEEAGTGTEEPQYWYNIRTGEVEEHRDRSKVIDLLGPFPDRETAARALEIVRERNKAWEEDD